ncbi:Uncharacterized protein FKW44_024493 [Caligus rogercresseyi]|uniref:Uncharacterized protein n=1 Tax=Caligus rogercresseyi TaxID=217165 RepID=A0A7T8JU60_CALRO|nr:Uncharacterized protein FKW44_024852 [Caligus rogercresseyi]QQP33202.1 Uncharacterized protein FKW44_024493 [Caligus rogercresseyi]
MLTSGSPTSIGSSAATDPSQIQEEEENAALREEESNRLEREARSLAIEKAYVHDVYEHMAKYVSESGRIRTWPKVRQFIEELEFGSLVCDVGDDYLNNDIALKNLLKQKITDTIL